MSYQIEEGEFISTLKGYETRYKTSLPIKDITSISYLHTDRFLSFQFKCKDECVYLLITDNYDKYISDQKKTGFLFELYGKIDASMIPRIQKALLHLIEIQGGNAQLVPYQKPKEAFWLFDMLLCIGDAQFFRSWEIAVTYQKFLEYFLMNNFTEHGT